MSEIANSMSGEVLSPTAEGPIESRIFRVMIVTVAVAVVAATVLAPWRVTTGLALGGALSLLNYHWLRTSVAAIFNIDLTTQRPRAGAWRYLIRYFVVGVAVFTAYQLNVISLAATFAGLCAFVPALFVEAFRQFYFAIILGRESH